MSVTAARGRHYDWVRLTYPRGRVDAAYGDGSGWTLPVPSWAMPNRESVFAPLSQLRDRPVILLASASGIGKSTALAQEHQALTESSARLVDLKTLIGKPDPVAYLLEQTWAPGPVPAVAAHLIGLGDRTLGDQNAVVVVDALDEVGWHVLLDGFDEAVQREPGLVGLLDQWLDQWTEPASGALRLRLATRPGVPQNTQLEEMLRRRWTAEGAVTVRDMAPLSRDDVLLAARARGIPDPEGFTAELEQRGLVPAANLPVTLEVLLDRAEERQPFPETAAQVYRLACEHLCQETDRVRRRPGPGLIELMRCAGYLAAVLEFCGNGVLTDRLTATPGGPVRLVDVADTLGPETGEAEDALEWLTATPLLRGLAESYWQFAHQGMQAVLAADCLANEQLTPASVQSLLFAGHGQDRYVHPRHRDVAGWLAWRRPEVYAEILNRDPAVLLSPDLSAQRPEVREEVVEALLTAAARSQETMRLQVLHRAAHPGLRAQLAARITRPAARRASVEPQPLMIALALAQACPDHAPVAELLDIAEDTQADESVRAAAVDTVPAAAVAASAGRLEALAGTPAVPVAAAALLALWPEHLATEDLLDRLPDPHLTRRVEARLRPADAGDVTAWMRRQLTDGSVSSPERVVRLLRWASSVLRPAEGEQPPQPATGQLAETVALLLHSDHAYDIGLMDVQDTWASSPAWRRLLAGEVLAHLTAKDTAALAAARSERLGLFPPEDSIYWARKAAAGTAETLAALTELVLPYPGESPELDQMRNERQASPQLEQVTARWFTPKPAWLRDAEQQAARHRADISSELEKLAAERPAPDDVRSWWGTLVQWLARDPSRFNRNFTSVHLDLSAKPSCPPDGSPLRLALRAAALHAVAHAPVTTAESISSIVYFSDACEVTALSLVDGPLDLTVERWAGLALVLAFANCDASDQDLRRALLTHASAAGGLAFTAALPAALSAVSPLWAANVAATLAEARLGYRVDEALLAWADAPDRPAGAWCDAMRSLAPYDRLTLPVLDRLGRLAGRGLPADHDGARRWAQAVDLMLLHGPADNIPALWEQVLSSEEATSAWGAAADDANAGFSIYAHSPVAYWPAAYQRLALRQAAELYRRLARQGLVDFPRPDPVRDISGLGRRGIHNRLPELIAEQLTEDAARDLQALAVQFPEHPGLPGLAADHARRVSENPQPLTVKDFAVLVTDVTSRIVRNVADLTRVVLDALDTLQEQALRSHGWSMLMWNREDEEATAGWWPTWEDNLSNLVCAFLREHLSGRKPVINREVEIQPSRLDGGRTDVLVQAPDPRDAAAQPLSVIIEVKGCWNTEIRTGIGQQLAPYLQPRPGWAGIFLVGHFHQSGREHASYTGSPKTAARSATRGRHRTPKRHTPDEILADLRRQQADVTPADIHVRVLRLPLVPPPARGTEARA